MKELLILWIGTSIGSIIAEFKNEFRIFKDVADAGYKIDIKRLSELTTQLNPKIDIKRLSELTTQLNPNASKITLLSFMIPIYNILSVCKNIMSYNNAKPMLLNQLCIINAAEEMTEIEKEEYQKNPTALNAIVIPIKYQERLNKAKKIEFNDGNYNNEILFEIGETLEDITILEAKGPISRLTKEEQKEKIIDMHKELATSVKEKYGSIEKFAEEINNSHYIDLNKDNQTNETDNIKYQNFNEQEKTFGNMELDKQETSQNDVKTLTKKMNRKR